MNPGDLFGDDAFLAGSSSNIQDPRQVELQGEIRRGVHRAHQAVRRLTEETSKAGGRSRAEARLAANVSRGAAERLREVMERFGALQSSQIKEAKAREVKNKRYFQDLDDHVSAPEALADLPSANGSGRITTQELIELEDVSRTLTAREKEINEVVRSIADLNLIFKDLAQMVVQQVVKLLAFRSIS